MQNFVTKIYKKLKTVKLKYLIVKMICEICNYMSDNTHNFSRHKCRQKTEFQCNTCKKYYKTRKSLNMHNNNRDEKCKNLLKKSETSENLTDVSELQQKVAELLKENEDLKEIIHPVNITQNITQNNIVINVTLPHKKTSIDHLTDADYFYLLGRSLQSIPLMIEKIHFNENNPENHNIYIPNIKNKFAMLYNGKEWSLHNRDEVIHNLIVDNEMRLEDWLSREDIQEKYPTAFKRFEFFLKLKEKNVNVDKMKEDVLLLLYNKRNMIDKSRQNRVKMITDHE